MVTTSATFKDSTFDKVKNTGTVTTLVSGSGLNTVYSYNLKRLLDTGDAAQDSVVPLSGEYNFNSICSCFDDNGDVFKVEKLIKTVGPPSTPITNYEE